MALFKPNAATKSAVDHPARFALTTAITVAVIVAVGGIASGEVALTIVVTAAVGVAVFLFDYWAFRPGGWGERWYRRNSSA